MLRALAWGLGVVVAVSLAVGGLMVLTGEGPFDDPQVCVAEVDGDEVALDLDQARYASLIAARATARDLPARATTIALATAYQESGIDNLDYGDRDSVGLFQQRPSQGWGTVRQLQRPAYAADAFYDALVEVDGYTGLEIHDAAQEVQRSADGRAYEQHERNARVLASAFSGNSPETFTCEIDSPDDSGETPGASGLTPTAVAVQRDVRTAFGEIPDGGYAPEGVTTGHSEDSAHYTGQAIDYFFRPAGGAQRVRGWALAHYLVANADRLDVATVIFDDRIWTARRSDEGWRTYDVGSDDPVVRHLDHVHVDVA